jgi:hypothetical protein
MTLTTRTGRNLARTSYIGTKISLRCLMAVKAFDQTTKSPIIISFTAQGAGPFFGES